MKREVITTWTEAEDELTLKRKEKPLYQKI